jgi:predicted small secreted protein
MKNRILTIALVLLICLSVAACSNTSGGTVGTEQSSTSQSVGETAEPPEVLDLTGGWKQTNSNSDTSYQIAMIAENTIEVYWQNEEDNSMGLYWAGTYVAPTSETNEYSWDSANDKSKTDSALLASGDDTKTFTYKDGVISYSVTAVGVTTTVELSRSNDVNINVSKTVSAEELLPLELVESGYAVKKGNDKFYIQYALIVKNPNTERAVEFPTVRITARDAGGAVLGTEDVVGSSILPGENWYSAFQGPSTDSEPASVDFELVQPDDSDWISPDLLDNVGEPLSVENPTKREDKIVGEVVNSNDFDINTVAIVVLFRDDSGKLLAGETTYTDKITAGGKIPFELSIFGSDDSYITDNFTVYAYPWF